MEIMAQSANDIQDRVHKIREFINIPWKHYELEQGKGLYFQLCSSLDVLGDTEELIDAYLEKQFGEAVGAHYLAVYGLLQGMSVQQDAAINLCKSLGISQNIDSQLKDIREVRNDSVVHPTKRDFKKLASYHHISRRSLSHEGFDLLSFTEDGKSQYRTINTGALIEQQRKSIARILDRILRELEQAEKAHREKFRMEKLTAKFPQDLSYHFQKLVEAISSEDHSELGPVSLDMVKDPIRDFREAVRRRDMCAYEQLQDQYDLVERAMAVLERFFRRQQEKQVTETDILDARIFAKFLTEEVKSLVIYAQQIDRDYEE